MCCLLLPLNSPFWKWPDWELDQVNSDITHHAEQIAAIAAKAALGYFRGNLGVDFKSDESPVTQADRGVEEIVRSYLAEHFPQDGVFGEEAGFQGKDRDQIWIVDPIDGTRSFLSGHPLFGFLLGRLKLGQPEIGVIGVPTLVETLIGVKGQGATMNGKPISVSDQSKLAEAVLFINEGEKIFRDHPAVFDKLMTAGQTRRLSYDCYPHALLAMGHVDAVVDYDLQPYDYLPVLAVVEAAGGVMTDWNGDTLTLQSEGHVVSAATPAMHEAVLNLIQAEWSQ
ncbi:inositol monophosphatase [Rhodobacteraceae bacterium M382]|nr:inositol monophosphatase [Rhodobacteraceae bacterium M382]